MNNDRVIGDANSLQRSEDRADALIDQCYQPKVSLLDAPIFFRRFSEEQLCRQAFAIQGGFHLLPFAHQPVPQRNTAILRKSSRRIETDFAQWMFLVEWTVIWGVRFYESDNKDKRVAPVILDELASVVFEKFWL